MNNTLRSSIAASLFVACAALLAPASHAAIVTSNDPNCAGAPTTRVFQIDTTPGGTCLAKGVGNLNDNEPAITSLGYVLLDKSDDAVTGLLPGSFVVTPPTSGLSGTFTINAPGYTDFVVAFKTGTGGADPDWAAFLTNGALSGSWQISGQQELSHASLYAKPVPLPAAAWLLLSGIAGLGAVARRRRTNARA